MQYELALKVVFVLLAVASGGVFLADALHSFSRGEMDAGAFSGYVGASCVTVGLCLGLLFYPL